MVHRLIGYRRNAVSHGSAVPIFPDVNVFCPACIIANSFLRYHDSLATGDSVVPNSGVSQSNVRPLVT